MEPKLSLQCSQQHTINPYPEPDESNPNIQFYFSSIYLILSSHLRLGLPNGVFPYRFPIKQISINMRHAALSALLLSSAPETNSNRSFQKYCYLHGVKSIRTAGEFNVTINLQQT
jgi:hypothetical protein